VPEPVFVLLQYMIMINVALAVFNMIPVYPLDGQKVLTGLLPAEIAMKFERFSAQYGTFLLMGVILFASNLIAIPFGFALRGLAALFGVPGFV